MTPIQTLRTMSDRLRALRGLVGISEGDVSALAGVPRSVVYALEKGPRPRVSADVLVRLALAFGTSPQFLLYGDLDGRFPAFVKHTSARLCAEYPNTLERSLAVAAVAASIEAFREAPLPRLADLARCTPVKGRKARSSAR